MSEDCSESARLFFGAHIEAPWSYIYPQGYPKGRLIPEKTRHLTFAFLGACSLGSIQHLVDSAPPLPFLIGSAGVSRKLLFIPPEKPHVVALAVEWLDTPSPFDRHQNTFVNWLKAQGYPINEKPFFPHITLARAPLDLQTWEESFSPLPLFVTGLHLYQSMGNLEYKSLWETPLLPPFEELEHTADLAFHIKGSSMQQLHTHAELALAFQFPPLVHHFAQTAQDSLKEIIISLNEMVSKADMEFGCPFKAVSFHGEIEKDAKQLLHWNMIVDV
jgi:RNA 2',3'-cyclic 3'-phosphodiesterase